MNGTPSFQLNDIQIGHKFNQYQLLEEIGRGGQGVVWSALGPHQEKIVALKFKEIGTEATDLKVDDVLFERQAGELVDLRHPHILPILDFGQVGQIQYLVSPFVAGGSLLERIRLAPTPLGETLRYAAEITSALSYLHKNGVIHRDLKPSNVLIDDDHRLFLADFGLARVVSETTAAMHTGHGTPPYAPPEQHTMDEITFQSDIFSFGIMLFELFTRELPWNGKKTLGIQQLHTSDQIPDPREFNPQLPPNLVLVLRLMTAAKSQDRPRTVDEVLPMLEYVFKGHPIEFEPETKQGANQAGDALQPEFPAATGAEISTVALNLTRFAMVELEKKEIVEEAPTGDTARFMLYNALTFDYKHEYWWASVKDPHVRLEVAGSLIDGGDEKITARVLHHITHDPELLGLRTPLPESLKEGLLEITTSSSNPAFRRQSLDALQMLTPPATTWQELVLSPKQEQALAAMALQDTSSGDQAARLIGHWRLLPAAEAVYQQADKFRRIPALLEIQNQSGVLPNNLPIGTRLMVTLEWIWQRMKARPLILLSCYLLIFLGASLSFGLKEYLSISGAGFMNMLNIVLSLERGALLGAPFALAVLLTRLIAERFPEVRLLKRLTTAALAGGIFLSISIFTYDVLVLTTVPGGFVYIAACFLIALGYSLSGLKPSRLWKIGVAAIATFTALQGSWLTYLKLASSSFALSPVFYFKVSWSDMQILGAVLLFTLATSVAGNLLDLTLKE